jgi:anion-transporting  ArsA/GET3 family ATPase
MIVCDTPEKITAFRLLALRSALGLEIKGLKRRGQSVFSIVKREFSLKGSKQSVYDQFEALLRTKGILA